MPGKPALTKHEWWSRARKRFWSKVDICSDGECWNWTGRTINTGYGQFDWRTYKRELSHRAAWMLKHIKSIPDGLCVLHTCSNRLCCNPAHLYLGTRADNMHDAIRFGEIQHGEGHHRSKLTASDVIRIREMYGKGDHSQTNLAIMFNVSQSQISRIIRKLRWNHL